jgi:Secretion system C-terminal sorting domain
MRTTIILLLLCLLVNASNAQNCDIAQEGVAVYTSNSTTPVTTLTKGQTATFRFSITNRGTSSGCSIPANSVTAIFDFPTLAGGSKPYLYQGPPGFVSGYFKWTYDSDADVLIGTNIADIPGGAVDANISVMVKANTYGSGNSNLNITQGKGVSDNVSNNFSTAKLIIPRFVTLSSFNASPDKCNVLLNWKTVSENNFSHFEVEYSSDGITFTQAGRVEGRNLAAGADYRFTYLQSNAEGYYRLKETAADGSFEYSDAVHVTTDCKIKPSITVFPNPIDANQKLIVTINGYSGKIAGELFNATGQKILVYNLNNGTNKLSVKNLSAGSYMLYVKDEGREVQSFKIIVTR